MKKLIFLFFLLISFGSIAQQIDGRQYTTVGAPTRWIHGYFARGLMIPSDTIASTFPAIAVKGSKLYYSMGSAPWVEVVSGTALIDSFLYSTKANVRKVNDSSFAVLMSLIAAKANASHLHPISDVTGLTTALSNKVNTSDTATMLSPYYRAANPAGYITAGSISGKVNTSDTSAMLAAYLNKANAAATYATLSGLSSKENSITAGTNLQYWRGDKTMQTLNTAAVPESGNLYFTNGRARSSISLTNTGSSGYATYNSTTGVLNVPNYGLAGLPLSSITAATATSTINNGNTRQEWQWNGLLDFDGGLKLSSSSEVATDETAVLEVNRSGYHNNSSIISTGALFRTSTQGSYSYNYGAKFHAYNGEYNYGLQSTGTQYGVQANAGQSFGATSYEAFAVNGVASGSAQERNYGGDFKGQGAQYENYGVRGYASGSGTINYGGFFSAENGTSFALRTEFGKIQFDDLISTGAKFVKVNALGQLYVSDSASSAAIDTSLISTKANAQKIVNDTSSVLRTLINGKQAAGSYSVTGHGHVIGDVTGLSTALGLKMDYTDTATMLSPYLVAANAATTYAALSNLRTVNGISIVGSGDVLAPTTLITSGTSSVVGAGIYRIDIDPAALLSTYTLTLPASPVDGARVFVRAGRQIAAGAVVVTSFTVSPNSGQTLYAAITPTRLDGGDSMEFQFESSTTTWTRIK
jgi:hypothetical protein